MQALTERAAHAAGKSTAHQGAVVGAATAQGASAPDKTMDVGSQAATEHVNDMASQKPGPFDAATFKAEVKKAIEGMAPPATLEEADNLKESGKAGQATGAIGAMVSAGKQASEQDIATSTAAVPDSSALHPKTVAPMINDHAGQPIPTIGAAATLPDPASAAQTDLSAGPRQVDEEMAAGNLTVDQLDSANEPTFSQALDARHEVAAHAQAGPAGYRKFEGQVLPAAAADVTGVESNALTSMFSSRAGALGTAFGVKGNTRDADQSQQDAVHKAILDIHEQTASAVKDLLAGLDTSVNTIFVNGEQSAKVAFEDYVEIKMSEYKSDRYGGLLGGAYWLHDKAFDLPDEVNEFYAKGRQNYLDAMDRVIDSIAALVTMTLTTATIRIALGRAQVQQYVDGLPTQLSDLGKKTAEQLDTGFDKLTADVDAAREHLVDTVARAYFDAAGRLDARITELQEENKGFVSKAVDFLKKVAKTIYELGKLLIRVLLKAASVVGDIVRHPIRFLENLIGGIKGGLDKFVANIGKHLEESMLDLLLGEIGHTGLKMPDQLDFAGIFDLVCQVLGLTYDDIRKRLVLKFGEVTVARMERTVEVFELLAREGLAGVWEKIKETITELPDLVIGAIEKYIVERVIVAGIGYIASLLTPVSAFIKACQGIIKIIGFIVEKATQIADFIDAVLDSIAAIAAGDISVAVDKVEKALAGGLTLAIGFLAKLANLDGIGEKVHSVINAVRAPVKRGIDLIIDGAVAFYHRTVGPLVAATAARTSPSPSAAEGTGPGTAAGAPPLPVSRAHAAAIAAQPPAQPPAQPAAGEHPITVTRDLAMAGTSHTLTVRVLHGVPQLVMASPRQQFLLTTVVSAIVQEEHAGKRADLLALLADVEKELVRLGEDWNVAHSFSDAQEEAMIAQALARISHFLQMIGKDFGVHDLEHLGHASKYVEGNQIRPEWAGQIRDRFYPSNYWDDTDKWFEWRLTLLAPGGDLTRFLDEETRTLEPRVEATIDHKPRVVEHWKKTGRLQRQPARAEYYNDFAHGALRAVAGRHNFSDGAKARIAGLVYEPTVGPDFRGPNDNP